MSGSLVRKLARWAQSPQGQRALRKAREFANDPRRRRQAQDAVRKLQRTVSGMQRGKRK